MITKKLQHLLFAIISSYISIIVCLIMFLISLHLICHSDQNSNVIAIFSGITTSVIATVIFRIFDKYAQSINTTLVIKRLITIYCDTSEDNLSIDTVAKQRTFHQLYKDISYLYTNLTYKKDFKNLLSKMSDMVKNIENDSINELDELKDLRDSLI